MSSLRRNIIANYAGKAWAAVINIAFVPLYIKYMGIEGYALVGIFATIQPLMTILDLGLSPSINRELARYSATPGQELQMRNLVRSLEAVYWGIAMVVALCVFLLSPLVASKWVHAQVLSAPTVERAVLLLGLSIVFQWPVGFYSGGLMGMQRQVLFNGINSIVWTVRGAGALLVVVFSSTPVLAFFWWQLLISIANVVAVALALWRSLPRRQEPASVQIELLRSVWRLAVGMSAVSVVILFFNQLDKLVLTKQIPLAEFGYYTLAWQVVGSLFMLYYPIYAAFFPVLTQLYAHKDMEGLKLTYHKGCQMMSVAVLPISTILAYFSRDILSMWVRDPVTVANCHVTLSVLVVGATFNGLLYMPYSIQQAFGTTKYLVYVLIPFLLVYAPLLVLCSRHYGILGAAVVFSLVSVLQDFIATTVTHRCLIPGEHLKWFCEDVGRPLIASLAIGGLLKYLISWPMQGMLGAVTIAGCLLAVFVCVGLVTPASNRLLMKYFGLTSRSRQALDV